MNIFFIRWQCSIASKIPNPKVAQQKHKISEFRRARIKSHIVLDSSGDELSRKTMEKNRHPKWTSFLLQDSVALLHLTWDFRLNATLSPIKKCSFWVPTFFLIFRESTTLELSKTLWDFVVGLRSSDILCFEKNRKWGGVTCSFQ